MGALVVFGFLLATLLSRSCHGIPVKTQEVEAAILVPYNIVGSQTVAIGLPPITEEAVQDSLKKYETAQNVQYDNVVKSEENSPQQYPVQNLNYQNVDVVQQKKDYEVQEKPKDSIQEIIDSLKEDKFEQNDDFVDYNVDVDVGNYNGQNALSRSFDGHGEESHGEIHYHQHKHLHDHAHKQEHTHHHKQEHKHEHGHKHEAHHKHHHGHDHHHGHHHTNKHDHKHHHKNEHKHGHHHGHKHGHEHGHHHGHKHHHGHHHKHDHKHGHDHKNEHKHHHHEKHDHGHHHGHKHHHGHHHKHGHKHDHKHHKSHHHG